MKCKIADEIVQLNYKKDYIHQYYELFQTKEEIEPSIIWTVREEELPELPEHLMWMNMKGFRVAKDGEKVYIHYIDRIYYRINLAVYEQNYHVVTYYLPKGLKFFVNPIEKQRIRDYIRVYCQEAFLLALQKDGGISIHSSTVIYKNKAIVFSALSGTGKTTHTNLWKKLYHTPILDGDLTVCRIENDKPFVYGLPWCGTSKKFLNQKVELAAIIFLSRGIDNQIQRLSEIESFRRLFPRSFVPMWFEELVQERCRLTEQLLRTGIPCFELKCNTKLDAAVCVKEELERKSYI